MSSADTSATLLCSARRPGGNQPCMGDRHRLPCTLAEAHDGDHRDASGYTWPRPPSMTSSVAECGVLPPAPSTLGCMRLVGHDGPHRNVTGRAWASAGDTGDPDGAYDRRGSCEVCGSPHGRYAPVTNTATCQHCGPISRPAPRRPVRMCVRCDVLTDVPVLVSEVHQASGPGWSVYACLDCAPHLQPLPDVLDLSPRSCEEGER